TVLYTSAEALRIVTALAHPVIPQATARIWTQLGLGDITQLSLSDLKWGQLPLGTKLGKVEPVFPRADKSTIVRMQQMEEQQRPATATDSAARGEQQSGQIATQAAPSSDTPKSSSPAASQGSAPLNKPAGAGVGADGKITIDDFAKIELRVA